MPDPAVILLAEDSEDDIFLIRRAFDRAHIPNPFFVVRDGEEAVAYLKGEGKYSNRAEYPLPDLMLLDLKMPLMTGFEVLRWVRQQPGLTALRILVLTSTNEIREVNQAYKLGANSFLVKPVDFENFIDLSNLIRDFWLRASSAPETSRETPAPPPVTQADRPPKK